MPVLVPPEAPVSDRGEGETSSLPTTTALLAVQVQSVSDACSFWLSKPNCSHAC